MEQITIDKDLWQRYFSGQATPAERTEAEAWINASDENRRTVQQMYFLQHAEKTLHDVQTIDTDAGLKTVRRKIYRLHHPPLQQVRRVAAVLLFLLIPAMAYLLIRQTREPQNLAGITVESPAGSIVSVVLPDSSRVWLNADSRIVYGQGYGIRHRRLTLSGEAFFEVRTNAALPLEVETGYMTVRATGTKFNVKAYPDENTVSAILTEGIINVSAAGNGKEVTLIPGQMAVWDGNSRKITLLYDTKTDMQTSWRDTHWSVAGATLGELAPVLQRRYAVKFVFENEALKTYKLRGEIPNKNLEMVLKALQLTTPLNYRTSNDTLYLTLNAERKIKYDKLVK
jgi:ferric-dicitrate binding protein FerR (iron transport regulator)